MILTRSAMFCRVTAPLDRLKLCVLIPLSLLPRWVKHGFWRITEPQHQWAHDAITEAILSRIDSEFEVAVKERPP